MTRPRVVVNEEAYISEGRVVSALARIYNASASHAVAVADVCDNYLDPSGRLLGRVRNTAADARRPPQVTV